MLLRTVSVGLSAACDDSQLQQICAILFDYTGHDFSGYKASTLARRIEKRVQERHVSYDEYVQLLSNDPSEAEALLSEVLISVTAFFRDRQAFAALNELAIPNLIQHATGGTLRVWVPACATGEEAYTLAILLKDRIVERKADVSLQIFGTDIDPSALEKARLGVFPTSIVEQLQPELLSRYFKPLGNGYRIDRELRDACIFSEHDITKDPPFSRIDLVSCRNLFIYFRADLQRKVMPLLFYGLRADGILFLGPAENMVGTDMFRAVDAKHRIYRRLPSGQPGRVVADRPARLSLPEGPQALQPFAERDVARRIATALLESHAPPAVVVDERGEVLFFSGHTGRYLEAPTGATTRSLIDLLRRPLRAEVHSLLRRAIDNHTAVERADFAFELDGQIETLHIAVRPLLDTGIKDCHLVVFEQTRAPRSHAQAPEQAAVIAQTSPRLHELEAELRDTREHLQSSIEQVRASNEELLSMNEELTSANEELHTSKQELQSTNEELEAVNVALSRKLEELDHAHDDLQNFFANSQVATLFLDEALTVTNFTPAAAKLFRLIPSDIGRTITDIASVFEDLNLAADFERVRAQRDTVERELRTRDGRYILLRASPYRSSSSTLAGLVVTFVDITELTRGQEARTRLAAIVEGSDDAIISKDLDGIITSWNEAAERMFGYTAAEMVGKAIFRLVPPDHPEDVVRILRTIREGRNVDHYETVRVHKDGHRIDVSLSVSPIRDASGRIIGASKIARDITAKKQAEREIQHALKLRDEFISIASHELKTPLTALKLQTQLLVRQAESHGVAALPPERMVKANRRLERQVERLTALVDSMLDVSRLSTGKLWLSRAPMDLSEAVREVVQDLSSALAEAGCQMRLELGEAVMGKWDRGRLEQVVVNLLTNTMRYAAGAPVTVRTFVDGDSAVLEVADRGIGISKADHARIFERFERASPDHDGGAFGVGLYVVREVVRAHRGRVELDSEPGAGATFRVILPKESSSGAEA